MTSARRCCCEPTDPCPQWTGCADANPSCNPAAEWDGYALLSSCDPQPYAVHDIQGDFWGQFTGNGGFNEPCVYSDSKRLSRIELLRRCQPGTEEPSGGNPINSSTVELQGCFNRGVAGYSTIAQVTGSLWLNSAGAVVAQTTFDRCTALARIDTLMPIPGGFQQLRVDFPDSSDSYTLASDAIDAEATLTASWSITDGIGKLNIRLDWEYTTRYFNDITQQWDVLQREAGTLQCNAIAVAFLAPNQPPDHLCPPDPDPPVVVDPPEWFDDPVDPPPDDCDPPCPAGCECAPYNAAGTVWLNNEWVNLCWAIYVYDNIDNPIDPPPPPPPGCTKTPTNNACIRRRTFTCFVAGQPVIIEWADLCDNNPFAQIPQWVLDLCSYLQNEIIIP